MRKNNKKPACYVNKCDIVDIAPRQDLNLIVDAFLKFRSLSEQGGYEKIQQKILEESGLDQEPDLLVRFEQLIQQKQKRELDKLTTSNKTSIKQYGR